MPSLTLPNTPIPSVYEPRDEYSTTSLRCHPTIRRKLKVLAAHTDLSMGDVVEILVKSTNVEEIQSLRHLLRNKKKR